MRYDNSMTVTTEAIYADGVLTPVQRLNIPEQQRVRITVQSIDDRSPVARKRAVARLRHGIDQMSFNLTGPLPSRDELHDRI